MKFFYEICHEIHKIMFDFAFPQYNDIPSGLCKQFMILLIVLTFAVNFLPEFLMRGGSGGIFASRMTVPETAVDENNSLYFESTISGFPGSDFTFFLYLKP